MTKLSDLKIKSFKPNGKVQRFYDGGGLMLQMAPKGTLTWYLQYVWRGKNKRVKLGRYPAYSLAEARRMREETKHKVQRGVDPVEERKQLKEEQRREELGRFEVIAREWYEKQRDAWAESHAITVIGRLERHAFPALGDKALDEISPQDVLRLIEHIESAGTHETAKRVLGLIGQVFNHGLILGLCDRNPCVGLHKALKPHKVKHMSAVLDPVRIGQILRMLDDYQGGVIVKTAMQLGPLLAVRPSELRHSRWQDLDLENGQWSRIVSKVDEPLLTPLSRQSVALIKALEPYTQSSQWLFPNPRTFERPMSNNAVRAALRSLGIEGTELTEHGWRATFRTLADEKLRVRVEVIEMALGHSVRDSLGRSYNRTAYFDERRELAQNWADYLDTLKGGVL